MSVGELGQLGPWAKIVSAVGIEPRSTLMKSIFVVYGFVWLIVIGCFALGFSWAWWAMLVAAAGTLWYLWTGTISGVVLLALLLLPVIRSP